jgi:hypothetical protein
MAQVTIRTLLIPGLRTGSLRVLRFGVLVALSGMILLASLHHASAVGHLPGAEPRYGSIDVHAHATESVGDQRVHRIDDDCCSRMFVSTPPQAVDGIIIEFAAEYRPDLPVIISDRREEPGKRPPQIYG